MLAMFVKAQSAMLQVGNRLRRQEGQGMVEYGLIIALVAVGLITALGLLRGQIVAVFTAVTTSLSGTTTTTP